MKNSERKKILFLLLSVAIFMGVLFLINNIILTFLVSLIIFMIIWLMLEKFNIEKIMNICFFIAIPFLMDYGFNGRSDYHLVTREYYVFNFLQAFSVVMLVFIIKNRKKVKVDIDLVLISSFVFICFISSFYAINMNAALFDAFRYFQLLIIYIYFSRIFNSKKFKKNIMNTLVIGLLIQLFIGVMQIITGGPIGLKYLGEGTSVFRAGAAGLEKGFSGTFGHPGPIALYACFILIWTLFDKELNRFIRIIGISVSSIIIVFAFGRSTILLMLLVYIIYFSKIVLKPTAKNAILAFFLIGSLIIATSVSWKQLTPLLDRFLNSDIEQQYDNRMMHYDIGFYFVKQKPILGIGINNYLDKTKLDYPSEFGTNFYLKNPIHNVFLLYAVEIGIIGVLVYISFILKFMLSNIKSRKMNEFDENEKLMLKGYNVTILIYSLYNMQGWGGVQTKSLIMFILTIAFGYNLINSKKCICTEEV